MNWEEELKKIWQHPAFADVKPLVKERQTESDRLAKSFEEINNFYETHHRLPNKEGDLTEKRLSRRLDSIRNEENKTKQCLPFDRFGLLKSEELSTEEELKKLFDNPIFAITNESKALFDGPEYLIKKTERSDADFVAQRKKCDNFQLYKPLFIKVHQDLKQGKRVLVPFKESHLQEGAYFLVGGVLVLLDKIFELKKDKNHKIDGRTHCVFENGTESNLLLRSLMKDIYLEGHTIQERIETDENYLKEKFKTLDEDVPTGYIYVLKSKSTNPEIAQYKDLYKIGLTTDSVEARIANAPQESTYLKDEVEIVASWKMCNLKIRYFEKMLHRLFQEVRLQAKIYHSSGEVITPKEWFIVKLPIIKQAINYIKEGVPVSYDAQKQVLEVHPPQQSISTEEKLKLKILSLNLKEEYVEDLINGRKTEERKKIKPSNVDKYTYLDPSSKKRGLKCYEAIKFNIIGGKGSLLVKVSDIQFEKDKNTIVYALDKVIERNIYDKKKR